MDIHEMHVSIDTIIQKTNSHQRRDILAEHKDLVLNWAINEYINSKIKSATSPAGFEETEVEANALQGLLKTFVPVRALLSRDNDYVYNLEMPADFRNFVDLSLMTIPEDCIVEGTKTVKDYEHYLYTFKIPKLPEANSYYKSIEFKVDDITIKRESEGISDPSFKRIVFNAIVDSKIFPASDIFWEYHPNRLRQPDTLIFKSFDEISSISLKIDGVVVPSTKVKRSPDYYIAPNSPTFSEVRRVRNELIGKYESSEFHKTHFKSPLITLSENVVKVLHGGRFIITIGNLTYIRKPAEVNLSLGIDCDIQDNQGQHKQICALAAQELMLNNGDPNWQARYEVNKINNI